MALDKYKMVNGLTLSMDTDGTAQVGDAVALVAPGTVGRGALNDKLFGKVIQITGSKATVQVTGVMVLNASATLAGDSGYVLAAVDGAGGLTRDASTAEKEWIIEGDTTDNLVAVLK